MAGNGYRHHSSCAAPSTGVYQSSYVGKLGTSRKWRGRAWRIRSVLHCSALRERPSPRVRRQNVRLAGEVKFLRSHQRFAPGRCFQRHRRRAKRPTRRERPKRTKVREAASNEVGGGEIFENCIEKNFHVSRHESGHQNLHPAEARASASRGMDLMVQFS